MEPNTPTVTPTPAPAPTPVQPNSSNRGNVLKRTFLIAVILLGLLTIGVVVYKQFFMSDETDAPSTVIFNEAEVTITKDGFSPATITVAPGTQITWINTDTEPHQVAADPYPKNDSIPGFDSTIILQKEERLSFIFEQAGTYTYHDELNAMTLKGTVVVE